MSAYDEILRSLPLDEIARQVDAQPQEVEQASSAILPALLGGLQANAADGGAGSIVEALGQHDPSLLDGGVDLGRVDAQDGAVIASHIFGPQQEEVAARLGGAGASGVGGQLVKRLIPILAPIVLSWLAKQVLGRAGGGAGQSAGGGLGDVLGSVLGGGRQAQAEPSPPTGDPQDASGQGPGSLEDMLQDVLGSATGGAATGGGAAAPAPQEPAPSGARVDAGSILTDVLGGLLGGGRR